MSKGKVHKYWLEPQIENAENFGFNRIPWLKSASIMDALNVKMSGRNAIEWSTLDIDLEIDSLKHPKRYPPHYEEE